MKKRKKSTRILNKIILIILTLIFLLFFIRLINPTEIDDLSPGIPCPEMQIYKPDILYVIPNYDNNHISENENWCKEILSINKTLGLHGIKHTYREFLYENISQEELNKGIEEFEKCFGYKPDMFKPPQLKINENNKKLIKENNLERKNTFNQITHKVYHCNDSDVIPNRIIKIF